MGFREHAQLAICHHDWLALLSVFGRLTLSEYAQHVDLVAGEARPEAALVAAALPYFRAFVPPRLFKASVIAAWQITRPSLFPM